MRTTARFHYDRSWGSLGAVVPQWPQSWTCHQSTPQAPSRKCRCRSSPPAQCPEAAGRTHSPPRGHRRWPTPAAPRRPDWTAPRSAAGSRLTGRSREPQERVVTVEHAQMSPPISQADAADGYVLTGETEGSTGTCVRRPVPRRIFRRACWRNALRGGWVSAPRTPRTRPHRAATRSVSRARGPPARILTGTAPGTWAGRRHRQ